MVGRLLGQYGSIGWASLVVLIGLLAWFPSAQAASFNWSSASCISATPCNAVGGITRFSNAVSGANPRDILLEVVAFDNGASIDIPAALGTSTSGGTTAVNYIEGRVAGNPAANAVSQVRFRIRFVAPGTTTDTPLPGPVYFTSLDTDGLDSATTGGFRERVEFITPTAGIATGAQLEAATAQAGGVAFHPQICTSATVPGCDDPGNGGVGTYVFYPSLNLTPNVAATAVYTGSVSRIDFAFGIEVSAAGPGSNWETRQYGIAGGVPDADMSSSVSCTPASLTVGTAATCTATCTNNGPDVALNPSCDFTGTLPSGAVRSASCGTFSGVIAAATSRSCSVTFTPLVGGTVNLNAGTGALNDTNGGTDPTMGNNPSASTVPVAGPSGADMSPVFSGLPTVMGPGQSFSGLTLTCSNASGGATALAATCVPTASAGTVSAVSCSPASGSNVAAGGSMSCSFTYQAPGTAGGSDEPVTSVQFTGTTQASNDGTAANNTVTATATLIDAVSESATTPQGTAASLNVLANDTRGNALASLGTTSLSVLVPATTGSVFDPTTGRFSVPATALPGTYTVTYQICANPAVTPAACDNAVATLVVTGNAVAQPDLQVSKTHSPATFTEGFTGTYTITARNAGTAATAQAYTVVDSLPVGMTVAAIPTGTGWDCSATVIGSRTATCSSSTVLAAGATAPAITLTVTVASGACAAPDSNGLCSVANGTALVNLVSISGGDDGNTSNNSGSDPTPVQQAGAVTGRVWLDSNHDRIQGSSEVGVGGMVVEVFDSTGAVVGTATTDTQGDYRVSGLLPGSGYGVRFREPSSGAYYGRPISKDPAGGNDPTADAATGVVTSGVIRNLTVPAGQRARLNQSLPVDPNGVAYNSSTRTALGGVAVELLDASGSAVPASCVIGGSNRVVTPSTGVLQGAYSFQLVNPAPTGCPGAGTYQLRITPPTGYAVSTTLPAQASTLTPPVGCVNNTATGGVCLVQAQSTPPTGSEATTWYTALRLDPAAGPDVVNNHLPLDSTIAAALSVSKTGDRTQAEIGDSVRYTVTVRRSDAGTATVAAAELIDTLPAGFRYIDGTAQLNGVSVADPTGKPGPVLRFALGALAPQSTVTLSYRVRIGVGSQQGSGINQAQATTTPGAVCSGATTGTTSTTGSATCSNLSQFRVRVSSGVFTTDACVVGKVFVDCNHNHVQDAEELGIPGVRFYLSDGTHVVSDVEGKYSVCGLSPRTHVMVVDQTTLPRGSRLTTSSNRNAGDAASLFLDLKNGELHRADFVEGSCSNTVLEQVKARRARGEVNAVDTEKRGGRVLKFDGKPVSAPAQATDSARQRGNAAGQGQPGAVKPRQDGGAPAPVGAETQTLETIQRPVSDNPASSGATSTRLQ